MTSNGVKASYGAGSLDPGSFFVEKKEVVSVIEGIAAKGDSWSEIFNSKLDWLNTTLSKYQEQPLLLNPCLPELTTAIIERLKDIVHEPLQNHCSQDFAQSNTFAQLNALCKVFQIICRVRGYKHVMKQLPHDVDTLEPCFYFLKQNEWFSHDNWETKYVFLLWLRMLCLIPFDICSIDSSIQYGTTVATSSSQSASSSKLVINIVAFCRTCLSDTGPTRESAALCLSTLLTRPDMEAGVLSSFCQSCVEAFQSWLSRGTDAAGELSIKTFEIIGILQCICQVFKSGHRDRILPHAKALLEQAAELSKQNNQSLVRKLVAKLIQRIGMTFLPPRVASWRYQRGQRSLLLNLQPSGNSSSTADPISCTEPQDDENEDFDVPTEMDDIFEYLLTALGDKDTVVRWSAAKGLGRLTCRLPRSLADDLVGALLQNFPDSESGKGAGANEADSAWHGGCLALAELARRGALLPSRLAEVVPVIIRAMKYDVVRGFHSVGAHVRDAACYVCWAFARAYSPVLLKEFMRGTEGLAAAMLTTALFDREVNCRRAAAAAYQENVGRQGASNFEHGLEIAALADYFSLGSRQNAYLSIAPKVALQSTECYVALWKHLEEEKLNHWDADIRVLASQALGRLALLIGDSPNTQLLAWPILLKSLENTFLPNCLSPSSTSLRHGSILAVSELILALSKLGLLQRPKGATLGEANDTEQINSTCLAADTLPRIVSIIPELNRLRLYRGRGSEYLRVATCYLIGCIASCNISLRSFADTAQQARKLQSALLDALNENLRQPHETVQLAAQKALRLYLHTYYRSQALKDVEKVLAVTVDKYVQTLEKEENVAVTRGYALALATLPVGFLVNGTDGSVSPSKSPNRIDSVLKTLRSLCSTDRRFGGEADPETRRNALQSAIEIVERLLINFPAQNYGICSIEEITPANVFQYVWDMLLEGADDYSADKRGDTGSWVRITAISGLARLLASRERLKRFVSIDPSSYLLEGGWVLSALGPASISTLSVLKSAAYLQYPNPSLGYELSNNASSYAHIGTLSALPVVQEPPALASSPQYELQLLSLCFRLLAEKLDSVRECAGNIIERLVSGPESSVSLIQSWDFEIQENRMPGKEVLVKLIERARVSAVKEQVEMTYQEQLESSDDESHKENLEELSSEPLQWAKCNHAFPFLKDVLVALPNLYLPPIVKGLAMSTGGLSETISREALSALIGFHQISGERRDSDSSHCLLINTLLALLSESIANKQLDRCVAPVLKSFDLLYSHEVIEPSLYDQDYTASLQLLGVITRLVVTTSVIPKIRSCVDLLFHLLSARLKLRVISLAALVNLLGHKFPSIRKYVAEALYLSFISDSSPVGQSTSMSAYQALEAGEVNVSCCIAPTKEAFEEATDILASSPWSDADIELSRKTRSQLCSLLDVDLSIVKQGSSTTGSAVKKVVQKGPDELDSYSSLVREAGY